MFYINSVAAPVKSNGGDELYVYDLSNELGKGVVSLSGWAILFPDTLIDSWSTPVPDSLSVKFYQSSISQRWNVHKAPNDKDKGFGYGTYYFRLKLSDTSEVYGFAVKNIKSAYRLYVNGKCIGGVGMVGKSYNEMIASRYQKELFFSSHSKHVDVLFQVSNFHHRNGGMTGAIEVGTADSISLHKARNVGIESFMIGTLFILFIYHFAIYAYRRKDRSILYFSLLCMSMFVRLAYTGERIFLEFLPFVDWNVATRIEYISFYLIPIFTFLFVKSLFPKDIPIWLVYSGNSLCVFVIVSVLFVSPASFSYLPRLIIFLLGPIAFLFLILIFMAWRKGREHSGVLLLGFCFYFLLAVHDVLFYLNYVNTTYLMPFGLFIISFSQAYVLAQKSSFAYLNIENLSKELEQKNKDQEKIISKRTKKIKTQKQIIEKKAIELQETNNELVKLANFKQEITSMMIHDLKSPLNNIIGFAELFENENKFFRIIKNSGWEMQNLIQNILDVDKYETVEYKPEKAKVELHDIVEQAYELTKFMIESRSISFLSSIPKSIFVNVNETSITRVFINIISNATKYCTADDKIEISCEEQGEPNKHLKILIYNSGDAIPAEKLSEIFDKYTQLKGMVETDAYSSGIGLSYCRLAINAHGGEIGVSSGKEKGVTFWFTLPV